MIDGFAQRKRIYLGPDEDLIIGDALIRTNRSGEIFIQSTKHHPNKVYRMQIESKTGKLAVCADTVRITPYGAANGVVLE